MAQQPVAADGASRRGLTAALGPMSRLVSFTKTHYFKSTLPRLYFGIATFLLLITLILVATTRDSRVLSFRLWRLFSVGSGTLSLSASCLI
jgi:hypothetical protein